MLKCLMAPIRSVYLHGRLTRLQEACSAYKQGESLNTSIYGVRYTVHVLPV